MSSFRALVIGGAGAFGSYTTATLAAFDDCEAVYCVGRDRARLERAQERFGSKVVPVVEDVRAAEDLARIARDCDVILNAAGPSFELAAAAVELALAAGRPYADLCDDARGYETLLGYDAVARERRLSVVAGCGCSGGITNIAAAEVAATLDEVHQLELFHGAPPGESLGGVANLRHLLDLIDGESPALVEGEVVAERTFAARRPYDFGPGVGIIECATISHPEPLMFRREVPGVSTSRAWLGLLPAAQMDTLEVLAAAGLASSATVVVGGHEVSVRDVVAHHLYQQAGSDDDPLHDDGPRFAVHVVGQGVLDGRPTQLTLSTLQGAGRMTGVPLAVGGRWLATGRMSRPGVHTAGVAVEDRSAFAQDLVAHGSDVLRPTRQEPLPR